MKSRQYNLAWPLLACSCLIVALAPAITCADGSITFNGTSSPSGGTSKLVNLSGTTNVLGGNNTMTICAWIYAANSGEGGNGYVVALDHTAGGVWLQHDSGSTLSFKANFGTTDGSWTFPFTQNKWCAVAVTYDKTDTSKLAQARVDFVDQTETPVTPAGSVPTVNAGYCIGNINDGSKTWGGRIAHVQIFNRILTAAEMDAALQAPGSITSGLRLWLPMTNASEITDCSGNAFNGTATDLVTDITGPMIHLQPGVLPGVTILSHGVTNKTQHVIPRFANGVTYPGGQLRGVGPASVIRATADTDDLASNKRGIVITEDYENPTAQWQSDTETTRKAVLQAAVRDLTISGYDETGTGYDTGGLVNNNPANWNRITGSITNTTGNGVSPIYITSANHTLQDGDVVTISGVLGNTNANGTFAVYDVVNADTFLIDAYGNGAYAGGGVWTCTTRWPDKYDGLLMRSSGLLVENVNFFYIPGTALVVKKGGTGGQTGPKLTFDREKARIWDCKVNRAYRGFWIYDVDSVVGRLEGHDLRDYGIKFGRTTAESSGGGATQIDGALHFWGVGGYGVDQPAVWFADGAGPCWGGPIYAESSPVGMKIESSGNKLSGFYSHSCSVRNLWISGQRNSVSNFEIEVQNGVTETSGGEGVLISAQSNSLANGTFGGGAAVPGGEIAIRLKGSNAGLRQVIRDVSFVGTASSSAPLISVEEALNDSTIAVKCYDAGTILDLYTNNINRLGTGNEILISTAGTITKAVNLNAGGWDDWNNTIIVDGVLQSSPTVTLTIDVGGAITITQRNHVVDTYGGAGSSNLTTINGGVAGRTIVLRAAHTDRTVVVTDGGNLKLNGNFSLNNTEDTITLQHDGTNWVEKARSDNGA